MRTHSQTLALPYLSHVPLQHIAQQKNSSLKNPRSQFEITKNRTKYDLCKFCFANRIVNIWNSLPCYVVSAETVNCFKTRLDIFWLNKDIIYNFRSEIHGTGSRSEITIKFSLE